MEVRIRPWGMSDLPLLSQTLGDPAMTEHLAGLSARSGSPSRQAHSARPDSRNDWRIDLTGASG